MQKICSESRLPDRTTLRRMKRPAANLAVTRTVIVVPYGSDLPVSAADREVPRGLRPHRSAGGRSRAA